MMNETCGLCDGTNLVSVYKPEGTTRNLEVYVCQDCALVQSLPRIDHISDHTQSLSSDATWGNIRYGKQFSTPQLESILKKHIGSNLPYNVLDVGAGRGWGAKTVTKTLKVHEIWCVEPDERLTIKTPANWDWITDRIENVTLPEGYFDLIVMLHTLEHLSDPKRTLMRLYTATFEGGWLYVSVPNLGGICNYASPAEWFIDKHCFHFTENTLCRMVRSVGFSVEEVVSDNELIVFCRKPTLQKASIVCDIIKQYADTRLGSKTIVSDNVAKLNEAMERGVKVSVWGAGRIFDAYRKAGLLVDKLTGIVDMYMPDIDFLIIKDPLKLPTSDVVVIMSNEYRDEIRQKLRDVHESKVIVWDDTIDKL